MCAIIIMVLKLLSKCQNHEDDCANFCGLLRKAELYVDSAQESILAPLEPKKKNSEIKSPLVELHLHIFPTMLINYYHSINTKCHFH